MAYEKKNSFDLIVKAVGAAPPALAAVGARSLTALDGDMAKIAPLFAGQHDGVTLARLFTRWRTTQPSMPALLVAAGSELGLQQQGALADAAALVSLAADVAHTNAYHDNNHFREVTAMMALYLRAHQGIDSAVKLSSADMTKCLIAAMAHDLHHDGTGNKVEGVHIPYRLEDKAIAAIEPLLALAGVSENDCADIRLLIRVTDVSAADAGISPHAVLRALLAGKVVDAPAELSGLVGDKKLQQMAALMSDADLAPSAATTYGYTRRQSFRIAAEKGRNDVEDKGIAAFIDGVVHGHFASAAAQSFSQDALEGIKCRVQRRIARQPK